MPQSASTGGVTLRAVVRSPDRGEQVASVGTVAPPESLERASPTTVLAFPASGLWTLTTDVDLPSIASDGIAVWTNPAVTLVTDFAGNRRVDWSWRPRCFSPLPCTGPEPITFSVALLRGDVTWTEWHAAFLASLAPDDRAALLAFDPRAVGQPVGWPRFQTVVDDASMDDFTLRAYDTTWQPCSDPGFAALAETAVPLSGGDTFVLQYGVQSDGTCTPQRPGLLVGTATPSCSARVRVLLDRLSGTLLMDAWVASPECTGP